VRAAWQTKRLGDVATLQRGFDLPTQVRVAGEFPLVSSSGISDTHHKSAIRGPGVVTGRSGSIGNVFFIGEDFWPLNTVLYVKDFHGNDPKFISYLLQKLDLRQFASGAGVPTLNRNVVHDELVNIPLFSEQKRIVAILDEAFAGIGTAVTNAEKNLANACELFDSYLNSVFAQKGKEWVENKIGEICENLDSRRVPITKSERVKGDTPYYGASGIVDYVSGHLFDEEVLLISEDGANLLARTYPIAFSVSGKSWVNNHAHVVRFSRPEIQKIVEFYLNSISLAPYVSGMAQPKLNQKSLNSIPISVPPIAEQARIVEMAETLQTGVERLEKIYREKLDALAELKQAILRKAFAGELTAQPEKVLEEVAA